MSSGSFKDTSKILNHFFQGSNITHELPFEVQDAIESYLAKHENNDEHNAQRLHEELVTLYNKHIDTGTKRFGAFLQTLLRFQPALTGQNRLTDWWNIVIKPAVDTLGHKRSLIIDAESFLLNILDYEVDKDHDGELYKISSHFTKILLGAYLKRTRLATHDADVPNLQDKYISLQLEHVLIAFGKRKPKDFMVAIDQILIDKDYRVQALGLLCSYVQEQPPHLYVASQTPLIEHLLKCLMIDTSTSSISLALAVLIMFLPHIPSSVQVHLPRLFLIYSRILCWEKSSPTTDDHEKLSGGKEDEDMIETRENDELNEDPNWEKLSHSLEATGSTTPELLYYYTFLYGLYPLNFMSYIRKPRKYLKNINFPRAQDFVLDQQLIQARSEQFRRLHVLHPSFYTTTVETELSDNRWLQSDPADVVIECLALCTLGLNMFPEPDQVTSEPMGKTVFAKSAVQEHEKGSIIRSSSEEQAETGQGESAIPSNISLSSSPLSETKSVRSEREGRSVSQIPVAQECVEASFQNMSNNMSRSAIVNQSIPRDSAVRTTAIRSASRVEANLAYLQREVILLRGDLNFERYLKNQHMSHIGQLQQRKIKEATIEAEAQTLLNANRLLSSKYNNVMEAYNTIKSQTVAWTARARATQNDLLTKLRALKEAELKWRETEKRLEQELAKVTSNGEKLRRLLVESESREQQSQRHVEYMQLEMKTVTKLRAQVTDLQTKLDSFRTRELDYQRAEARVDRLTKEILIEQTKVLEADAAAERNKKEFDTCIRELTNQLRLAQSPESTVRGRFSPVFEAAIDHAIDRERRKSALLRGEHEKLQQELAELRRRYHLLETEHEEQGNLQVYGRQSSSWSAGSSFSRLNSSTKSAENAVSADASASSSSVSLVSSGVAGELSSLSEFVSGRVPSIAALSSLPERVSLKSSDKNRDDDCNEPVHNTGLEISKELSGSRSLKGLSMKREERSSSTRSTSSSSAQKETSTEKEKDKEKSTRTNKSSGKSRLGGLRGYRGTM